MSASPTILVIAGEVSGDMQAARLVQALRARMPQARFVGIGGPEMRAAGVETRYDIRQMAVMGFLEVLRHLRFFRRVFYEMLALARERRPEAVILVDYPGFNLRFAAQAHAMGLRVIYYICPQVWAWHRERIPQMARVVDRLITIFPFEAAHFEGTGLRVTFVGHPFVEETRRALEQPEEPLPWPGPSRVALLPGSRRQEISRILPALWRAAAAYEARHPEAGFLIAAPSPDIEALIRARLAQLGPGPSRWGIVTGRTREVLRQARAALVASGTATLEAALMGCPMVVVYKTAPLTFFFARRLVRLTHIGMVNIVAGREVCPERIQDAATPAALAEALEPLVADAAPRARIVAGLLEVRAALGPPGAEQRAAEAVLEELAGGRR